MKISSLQMSDYRGTSFGGNLAVKNLSKNSIKYYYTNLPSDRAMADSFIKLHTKSPYLALLNITKNRAPPNGVQYSASGGVLEWVDFSAPSALA